MPRRIVLLGATGYVGGLTAAALVHVRVRPVLVGRDARKLAALGARLGHGLDTEVVDLDVPSQLPAVLRAGDVVVNVVGPFARYGRTVVEAAIQGRAAYIDCAAEPTFIRSVFDELGPVAGQSGSALVPGFGHEHVAGNLAAGLALEECGESATRVDIGYFQADSGRGAISSGTRASRAGAAVAPQFAWRGGQLVATVFGDRVRTFSVDGTDVPGLANGGLEHITIPRLYPSILEVGVYVGVLGSTRAAHRTGRLLRRGRRLPGVSAIVRRWSTRAGDADGPDEEARARSGSIVVAAAYGSGGDRLSTVTLEGVNHYTFTAETLAWAALRAAQGTLRGEGALGPVEAFGLAGLREACAGVAGVVDEPGERTEHGD